MSFGYATNPLRAEIAGRDDVDDLLTLDLSENRFRSDAITFRGGGGTGSDTVEVKGGDFATITQRLTGVSDGVTLFDPAEGDETVTLHWFGLEPFLLNVGNVDDLVFELPAGITTAVLEDADPADADPDLVGKMQLRSPDGHFEQTVFSSPSGSLTIRGGAGGDAITIASLDPAFGAELIIDGDALGSDAVTLLVNTIAVGVPLDLTGTTITVAGAVNTGDQPIRIVAGNTVQLDATVTTTATVTIGGGVVLTGAGGIDADVVVQSGATLGGTGTISGDVRVNAGAKITGGTLGGVGTLTLGGLSFNGGTYQADVAGDLADQLRVSGTIDLQASGQGVLGLNASGIPSDGHVLTLIDNTGAGACCS